MRFKRRLLTIIGVITAVWILGLVLLSYALFREIRSSQEARGHSSNGAEGNDGASLVRHEIMASDDIDMDWPPMAQPGDIGEYCFLRYINK